MLNDSYNLKQYAKAEMLLRKGYILRFFDHSGNPSAFVTSGEADAAPIRLPAEVAQQIIEDGLAAHITKGWNYDDYALATQGPLKLPV